MVSHGLEVFPSCLLWCSFGFSVFVGRKEGVPQLFWDPSTTCLKGKKKGDTETNRKRKRLSLFSVGFEHFSILCVHAVIHVLASVIVWWRVVTFQALLQRRQTSFQPSPRVCRFWSTLCELCKFLSDQCRVEQLLLSTACTVRELSGTSGACCCCSSFVVSSSL